MHRSVAKITAYWGFLANPSKEHLGLSARGCSFYDGGMSTEPVVRPTRARLRCFQFSIRSVLILTTLVCICVGVYAIREHRRIAHVTRMRAYHAKWTGYQAKWGGLGATLNYRATCDEEVKTLHLGDKGLTKLPSDLMKLTNVTKLWLHHNELSDLPPDIGELSNLTRLTLHYNKLTELPDDIGKLTKLTGLFLHNNELTKVPPRICDLANLTELHLGNNQLTTLPRELSNLTNLEYLDISGNKLPSEEVDRLKAALPQCEMTHD